MRIDSIVFVLRVPESVDQSRATSLEPVRLLTCSEKDARQDSSSDVPFPPLSLPHPQDLGLSPIRACRYRAGRCIPLAWVLIECERRGREVDGLVCDLPGVGVRSERVGRERKGKVMWRRLCTFMAPWTGVRVRACHR